MSTRVWFGLKPRNENARKRGRVDEDAVERGRELSQGIQKVGLAGRLQLFRLDDRDGGGAFIRFLAGFTRAGDDDGVLYVGGAEVSVAAAGSAAATC